MRTDVEQGLLVLRGVRDFLAVIEIKPELGVIAKHVEELDEVIGTPGVAIRAWHQASFTLRTECTPAASPR